MSAAHHRARRLIAIVDRNEHSLDGKVEDVMAVEPLADKWRAFGWATHEVDGHDVPQLLALLQGIVADDARSSPAVVIAHTVKGKGVSFMENELGWHLGYLAADDEERALAEIRGGA